MIKQKRGQVSTEYLLIVGVVLLLLIPIFSYSIQKVNNEVRINKANDVVTSIARAANVVYSLGPGTKRFIEINIPKGVNSAEINGSLVQLQMSIFGGSSDFYSNTITNITGTLPSEPGTYHISLEAQDDGTVRIGGFNDTSIPTIIWSSPNGTIEVQDITLQATTNEVATCRYDTSDITYTSMSSFFDGTGLTHTDFIGSLAPGNYTYYARCSDTAGNVMTSSTSISFTLFINSSSGLLPIVTLEGPTNNTQKNFNIVKFTYNVTSPIAEIAFCSLKLDGTLDIGGVVNQIITDNSVSENISNSLTTSLVQGDYTWYVNCTDNTAAQNEGNSETWNLRINASLDETYINSCDGWCGYNGFSEGACENNIPKCNNNCGLPYSQNRDCYAGINTSDTYCLGGSESDTCCCLV